MGEVREKRNGWDSPQRSRSSQRREETDATEVRREEDTDKEKWERR
jgi:hypothetical protein